MLRDDSPAGKPYPDLAGAPWWRDVTRYQWFVFAVASLGWLFDTMDQQLFNLARNPAIIQLLGVKPGDPATTGQVAAYSAIRHHDLPGRLGTRRDHLRNPGRQARAARGR